MTVIHIGFPKTGTTSLQEGLFARHPGIQLLGVPYAEEPMRQIIQDLRFRQSYHHDMEDLRERYRQFASAHVDEQRVTLISDEDLVCMNEADQTLKAERLCGLVGDAKIIITIREQFSFLESLYLWKVENSNRLRFDSIESWLQFSWDRFHKFDLAMLRHSDFVDIYAGVFGAENVGIFLFEDMIEDEADYVQRLAAFMDVDETQAVESIQNLPSNQRRSSAYLKAKSMRDRSALLSLGEAIAPKGLKRMAKKHLSRGKAAKAKIPETWREKLAPSFVDSNQALAEHWNVPLARHGYVMR